MGGMILRAGMYYTLLYDWFQVFPRSQFLIIKAEDYYSDMTATLSNVYSFLGVRKLPQSKLKSITLEPIKGQYRRVKYVYVPMMNKTRTLLEDFYGPYNNKLSVLLNNPKFTW